MKITILTEKPINTVEIAKKLFVEIKCIVLMGKRRLNVNSSFYGTKFNNCKFSFN